MGAEASMTNELVKKQSLMQMVAEANEAITELIEAEGELSVELEKRITISNLKIGTKIDSYAFIWERSDLEEKYFKDKATEYLNTAKQIARLRNFMKERIKFVMREMDTPEIKGNDFKFKLASTAGRVEVYDEKELPEKYVKTVETKTPNKSAIRDALVDGAIVHGAKLVFDPSLRKQINKNPSKGK